MTLRSIIIIITLLSLNLCSFSFAQNPFINYSNGKFNTTYASIENYKGNFILCGTSGIYNSNSQDAYIIKFSKNGEFINSLSLPNLSKSSIACAIELPNNNIAYFGNATVNDTLKMLCVITDENLNIVSLKTYSNLKYAHYPQTVRLKNDTIIVTGMYYNEVTLNSNPYVYKLNFSNDTLETDYLELVGDNWGWQSIEMNNKIKLTYYSRNPNPNYGAATLTTDLNFETITDTYIITNKMPHPTEFVPNVYSQLKSYIKQLNDSTILSTSSFSGMFDKPPYSFIQDKIAVYKTNCNKNDTVVKYLILGKTDTINNEAINTINFIDKENIYIGYNSGMNQYSIFPSSDFKTSYGCITKIDTNLNIVWQKYFGNNYHYNFYSLLACKDDGAMLSGNYSDYNNLNDTRNIVAFKLDKNGNEIYGVGIKNEVSNTKKVHFFPNPTANEINLINLDNGLNQIIIYDVFSKIVLDKQLLSSNNSIKLDLENFSSGIYFFEITNLNSHKKQIEKIIIQK